jgi:2,4-dienoyl-CoA reductase (NADPH2)
VHLLEPLALGPLRAPNRLWFGPLVTNLGDDDRRPSVRDRAFYARRAVGGCGVLVLEGASVHESDWPYERAPLAERCADGWASIAAACRPHGSLVVASLDHAGGQGSSAYSQRPLWAPSRVPEVATREVPKWMEPEDIAAVVDGFGTAARLAAEAGLDGVEVNAGQHSLVRQFLSALTNHRSDEWGQDRARFARDVLCAARAGLGTRGVLGLRLCADELAPWAGVTPEMAPAIAAELATCGVDYVVVVRGSIFSAEKTRPDFHEPTGFNIDVCRAVRQALPATTAVVLQGSVVDPAQAEWAIGDGVCDAVEMSRAQLADPDLGLKLAGARPEAVRPCTRCNQTCQVRDARNPVVTCVLEPTTGHETTDADWVSPTTRPRHVQVVGGGPAGLEAARVAAIRGHHVRLVERAAELGGVARVAGPAGDFVRWQVDECRRLGVRLVTGTDDVAADDDELVIQATGSLPGEPPVELVDGATMLDIVDLRAGRARLPERGAIVVFDPIGGPIGVALAEELGDRAVLVTQDQIAGNELSRTGDLAPANVRLAQRGVHVERRTILRSVRPAPGGDGVAVEVEARFTGERRTVEAAAVVDCGFRIPDAPLPGAHVQIGDCLAPRTIHEAVLEGRRAALLLDRL